MKAPLLHSVIDLLLVVIDERPELARDVMHFIFDESSEIRAGLCDVHTRPGCDTRHLDGSVSFSIGIELRATERLIQFAHAVSQGIVPPMAVACAG